MLSVFKNRTLLPWVVCGLGALYYCYEYFLRISPSVMTPELMSTYHLTGAQVGSLSAFYYHAYMPMQLVVGLLMDRYGPRYLLTLACFLCAAGTYLFAGGFSLTIATVGRFMVGFGSAFAFVGALKLATVWLPPNRFALISGVITMLGMLGAMMGDILLRFMVDGLGWQLTNYFAAIAGLILTGILWGMVRDTNPHHSTAHFHHIYFKPLLSELCKAIRNPQIWISGLIGCLLYLSLSAFGELWGIPYLEQAQGLSKTQAATCNSMIFLGWAIGAPFWGWFSDWVEKRRLLLILAGIAAFILVVLLLYVPGFSFLSMNGLFFGFGFFTSVEILVFAICREVCSAKISGTAIALTNMIIMVGGNIFQPLVGKLLDLRWSGQLLSDARIYSIEAYQFSLAVLPLGLLLAVGLAFFLRESYGNEGSG